MPTIVAITNHTHVTFKIKQKEKRKIKEYFKRNEIKYFPPTVFAILAALAIKHARPKNRIVVDREYLGYEAFIKHRIQITLKALGMNTENVHIEFGQVGKHAKSHKLAYATATKSHSPDFVISAVEIIKIYKVARPESLSAEGNLTAD